MHDHAAQDANHTGGPAGSAGNCPPGPSPRVSYVVPCYNARRYLRECLASITATASESYEIAVVDDGSTEEIEDIVKEFEPQARYIRQHNQGPGAARNTGIRVTTGPYIRFVDADDVLLSAEALQAQVEMLEADPSIGLIYGQSVVIDADGQPQGVRKPRFARSSYVRSGAEELNELLLFNYITTSSTLVRRSVVERAGCFRADLRSGQDYELWLRMARISSFGYLARPVVAYRKHSQGVTARKTLEQRQHLAEAVDQMFLDPDFARQYASVRARIDARRRWKAVTVAYRAGQMQVVRRSALREMPGAVRLRDWELAGDYAWLLARALWPDAVRGRLRGAFRRVKMRTLTEEISQADRA